MYGEIYLVFDLVDPCVNDNFANFRKFFVFRQHEQIRGFVSGVK